MAVYGFSINVEGNSITQLKQITAGVEGLNSKVNSTTKNMSGGFNQIKNTMAGMLGAMGVGSLISGITEAGKAMLSLGMNMEQTKTSFEVMLGSGEKAGKLIKDLQEFSKITPFTSTEVMDNAKMLLNYNVAGEKVLPTMRMLGDASGGVQEKFRLMSYAYAQVQSAGRLMGQDLMQLVNAGFNPLQEISKRTGRSMAELKEDMGKGKISADMVTQAFIDVTSEGGRFYDMMNRQSKTTAGLWSNFMETIQQTGISIFESIAPYLNKFIVFATNNLGTFISVIGSVISAFIPLFSIIGSIIGVFVDLAGWFQKGSTASKIIMGAIVGLGAAVLAYIAIQKLMLWWQAAGNVVIFLSILATEGLGAAWTFASGLVVKASKKMTTAIGSIPFIGWIAIAITALIALSVYFYNTSDNFRAFINGIWSAIKNIGGQIMGYFVALGKTILGALTFDVGLFSEGLAKFKSLGESSANAYNQGFKQSLDKDQTEKEKNKLEALKAYTKVGRVMTMKGGQKFYVGEGGKLYSEADWSKKQFGDLGGGGISPLKKGADKTSTLGASGGLGEAKVINIHIDTMQKNEVKSVSDFKTASGEAIEILTRALNNLVYSASATM